jgi:hypothetical protein
MSAEIFIRLDTAEMERRFGALPQQMPLAVRRASIRTREWLRTQLAREISATADVPQKALRGRVRRGSRKNDGAWYGDGQAVLWIGLNAISASHAGTPVPNPKGVRVRRHFFDKAFVVNVHGFKQVFKRVGPSRLPIVRMTIPLSDEEISMADKYLPAAERMFSERLEHEINFLIERAA